MNIAMTKKEFSYPITAALVLTAVLISSVGLNRSEAVQQAGSVKARYAIDGDTIKLSTGEHVRLIGIDTPESRYNNKLERDSTRSRKDMKAIIKMGKEASSFTKHLVEDKSVRLEFDVQKYDRYGRLLAYVYLEDGTFVNAKIVEEGYAQVLTIPPNVRHADLFLKLQQEAREKRKGLWRETQDTLRLF